MATTQDAGKPRFKQELVAEAIEDGGARYIDVMDPDSGNIFRFYEVEYALACAMDGERDVAGIVKWAQEELGVTPTPVEVNRVIATLGDLGYLDRPDLGAGTREPIKVEQKPAAAAAAARPEPLAAKPMPASDELARGVVVGAQPKTPHTPAEDVALGAAGTTAKAQPQSMIEAPDLALGKPGAPAVAKVPAAPVEDIPLGLAGSGMAATSGDSIPVASDVSLDLSDNMKIGLGDVKEAVRASRVMSAVEVPKELMAELEAKPEPKKPEPKKPDLKAEPKVEVKAEPKVEAKTEPKKPEPKAEPKKPEPKAEPKKPEPKVAVATTKPETKKPPEEKKPVVPPAPEKRTSPVLIVLLILVVLGGGFFAVWKFVLNKDEGDGTVTQPTTTGMVGSAGSAAAMVGSAGSGSGSGSAAPVVPPPPAEITAKLASEAPAPADVKPLAANTIEKLVADPTKPVKQGDVIALMQGAAKLQGDIDVIQKAIVREQAALDAATKDKDKATAANDTAGATKAGDKIKDKTAAVAKNNDDLNAKKAELDKLSVTAPADGKLAFTPAGKVGQRTADAIATITSDPMLTASFALPSGTKSPDANASVTLTHKADGAQLTCTVIDTKPDSFKVKCDASTAKADDDVSYKP